MTWIKTVPYEQANGQLLKLYDRVKGPGDNVDNIMLAHSLRPHTLAGHMSLYKRVLHHPRNEIDKWFLEAIGVLTSLLNSCEYCIEHHYQGLCRLLNDQSRASEIRDGLTTRDWQNIFDARESAALDYSTKLTEQPAAVSNDDIRALRRAGWSDGQILEINQVTAYFNYANRTVLGLGVDIGGDVLGLSPGDDSDPDNWAHR